MKVLIVEDEKIIRNGLVNHPQWKKWGVEEVREASNAEEALMLLLSYQPDFVCSDIKMPGMDGLWKSTMKNQAFGFSYIFQIILHILSTGSISAL